ncbi:hypothetical protein Taro_037282 [Colocasia esculenta]|uniref:Uncharacterized protein n=1 Tax=Colocasia esculenta TaxID=4460 RepID=A0A843WFT3_COLES|nr:hypothetical protein [Colocasia esculenta]
MSLFLGERRGPKWKHGWKGEALSSLTLPPGPLLAVLAIVVFLMTLSGYVGYRAQVQHTANGLRLVLFVLPVALVFVVRSVFVNGGRFVFRLPRAEREAFHRAGSSPWGVAALVGVLLVMVAYQSSFHSQWFRPLWRDA